MKIKYLGTAAYEGVPAPYCECAVCKRSRETGGRAVRTRSQALIDGVLLIDFNADTYCHSLRYFIDWSQIGDCLITHSHSDHLYPADLEMLSEPYSHRHKTLHFYAAQSGFEKIKAEEDKHGAASNISVSLVEPGKPFAVADGAYTVLPLRANHDENSSPVFYAIRRGEKRMLYAHDTGVFFEEVYEQLKTFGRLDLVSFECTGCLGHGWDWRNGHMSLKTNLEVLARLQEEGIVDAGTTVVANHFSHNGGQTYDEMVPVMAKRGIIVSYDGLEIEF